jgi:carbamoyltransferase
MPDTEVTLGVTYGTHDSSAALFIGDALVGFCEEERLNGIKHAGGYPQQAISWLLAEMGCSPADVNMVASSFRTAGYAKGGGRALLETLKSPKSRRGWERATSYGVVYGRTFTRTRNLAHRFSAARVCGIPHHLSHSRYAHAASGEEHVAVLTVDSIGEWESTSIVDANADRHRTVLSIADPHSLGYAYGAVTEHLGYTRGDEEGTVMALAGLGDPSRYADVLRQGIALTERGIRLDAALFAPRVFSASWPRLTERFAAETIPQRQVDEALGTKHADLAAALQQRIEEALLHLGRLAAAHTGARTLCLTGGVAMNCLAAGLLSGSGLFERVFVPPAPEDAGTAIGAALATLPWSASEQRRLTEWDLGPSYSKRAIDDALATGCWPHRTLSDPVGVVAGDLAAGRIVGVVRGRMEAGPRSLGHRSILASPLVPEITSRLAAHVKLREPFRPFAPVLPSESASEYFAVTDGSPYMSFAFRAREKAHQQVPAVVHRNGTARVQTVNGSGDGFLYEVLLRFAAHTGVPVLINTSMNIKGRPMAASPHDALTCFGACELDALLLEDRYLTR